jgi:hypothetical protein
VAMGQVVGTRRDTSSLVTWVRLQSATYVGHHFILVFLLENYSLLFEARIVCFEVYLVDLHFFCQAHVMTDSLTSHLYAVLHSALIDDSLLNNGHSSSPL